MTDNEARMTIGEHVEELRGCLLRALIGVAVGMAVSLYFGDAIFRVIFWPLSVATGGSPPHLHPRSLQEPFMTYLRVCLIVGAVVSAPHGLYQMWKFIGAGLYEHERRAVRRYLLPSILLFFLGVAFFFVLIAPIVVKFFLGFAQGHFPAPPEWGVDLYGRTVLRVATAPATGPAGEQFVQPLLTLQEYVSFTAMLSLVFGVAFQTPLVVMCLGRSGIIPVASMRAARRYVLLTVGVLSAIFTPPDVISMIAMAIPTYLLYEVGLLLAGRSRRP